jgi:uncharacterized lipoprotein YajG
MKPSITNSLRSKTLISTGWNSWKKRIQQLQQKNLHALQVCVKFNIKEKVMKKSILVGLVALSLAACAAKEEEVVVTEPEAAAAEAPAADAGVVGQTEEAAPAAVEAAPADAAVVEAPVVQ